MANLFEEKILDLAKEKAAIDDQEKRMNNISSKLSIQEIELRTRFKEVQEAVICHAMLSAALHAPTEFRLLNAPRRLGSKVFRVGYCDGKRAIARDIKRAESIMLKNKPSGMTSIPAAIADVRNEIIEMVPQLEAEDSHVAIVIATDGCNYNKNNIGRGVEEEGRRQRLRQDEEVGKR